MNILAIQVATQATLFWQLLLKPIRCMLLHCVKATSWQITFVWSEGQKCWCQVLCSTYSTFCLFLQENFSMTFFGSIFLNQKKNNTNICYQVIAYIKTSLITDQIPAYPWINPCLNNLYIYQVQPPLSFFLVSQNVIFVARKP